MLRLVHPILIILLGLLHVSRVRGRGSQVAVATEQLPTLAAERTPTEPAEGAGDRSRPLLPEGSGTPLPPHPLSVNEALDACEALWIRRRSGAGGVEEEEWRRSEAGGGVRQEE